MSERELQEGYDRLGDEVDQLVADGRYAELLDVLDAAGPGLEPWASDLDHLRACLLGRLGRAPEALGVLEAGLARGDWWHERILLEDDDLAGARELPGFAALVAASQARLLEHVAAIGPVAPVTVRPPGGMRGVVVVLHGAGETADATARAWSPAAEAGWLVVAVPSTQLNTPRYASWPEQAVAERDVAQALASVGAAPELPVVAAGFSAGGRAALLWGLSGRPVEVAGVVAVAPAIWPDQVDRRTTGLRGRVVVGSADDLAEPVNEALSGLPRVRVEVVDGLGHRLPDGFDGWLVRALDDVAPRS